MPVEVHMPDDVLDAVARRLAAKLTDELKELGVGQDVPRWVDAKRAAEYLAFSVSKLQKLTTRNQIPHHHHDGRVHYRTDELDAWLTKH
jgi:hypothetical protein